MKKVILFLLLINTTISIGQNLTDNSGSGDKFIFTYQKNGKKIVDTVILKDNYAFMNSEINKAMEDHNYKPKALPNDTIFDDNHNPIIVILADDIFGAQIQRFNYDNLGHLIDKSGYNRKGILSPFDKDIAIQKFKYDKNGNVVEIRNMGANGDLISSEFEDTPIIKKVYDQKNRQIEEWYLNEKGQLRSEYSIVKYKYNTSGKQTIDGWYNEKGSKGAWELK